VDVFQRAVAIAVTDGGGIVRTASLYPDLGGAYSLDDIIGVRLVPSSKLENLVTLSGWRAARIQGVSIAYAVPVRNSEGVTEELEAIATALAGTPGWLVVLVQMEPHPSLREAELEGHLWRIAAELEASGILMRADRTPGLSLARIGQAASLTPRQWEVLRRITAGQRVPTIAKELYVSQSTVRNHLAAIFQRFGVHSQADLLARLSEGTRGPPDGRSVHLKGRSAYGPMAAAHSILRSCRAEPPRDLSVPVTASSRSPIRSSPRSCSSPGRRTSSTSIRRRPACSTGNAACSWAASSPS
jgi:DNA-binding NarL/FixJ family response regulator